MPQRLWADDILLYGTIPMKVFSVAGPWLIVAVSLALFGCSGESGHARVQGSAAVRLQRHLEFPGFSGHRLASIDRRSDARIQRLE